MCVPKSVIYNLILWFRPTVSLLAITSRIRSGVLIQLFTPSIRLIILVILLVKQFYKGHFVRFQVRVLRSEKSMCLPPLFIKS